MTFSDKRVAEAVNTSFVAAWVNRGPGFQNLDFHTESWIFQGDLEAYPTKNICTFFLTPQGKVFYYVAGSYSPEMFLRVLDTATGLRGALFDASMKEMGGDVSKVHLSKAEEFDGLHEAAKEAAQSPDEWKKLFRPLKTPTFYRGMKHKHTQRCANSLAEGYEYFAQLHRAMAAWTELPVLESVRYTYLYGNEFSEETADAKRIERLDPSKEPPKPLPPPPPKTTKVAAKGGKDAFGLGLPGLNLGPLQPE
ncbi:MAG TPA: hypothetical protein VF950_13560 [Planctomycetota bacterium]